MTARRRLLGRGLGSDLPFTLFAIAGAAVTGVYVFVPSAVLWNVLAFATVGAVLVGIRLHRPQSALPWLLFAAGVLLNALGDLVWDVLYTWRGAEEAAISPADAFYLASYPLFAAALFLFVRAQRAGRALSWSALLDTAILVIPFCALAWILLIEPVLSSATFTTLETVQIIYPVADLGLLALLVWLTLTGSGSAPAAVILFAGFFAWLVADAITRDLLLAGTYEAGEAEEALYLGVYVAWGLAALHPSMRRLVVAAAPEERLTRRRIAFLGAAAVATPLILIGTRGELDHFGNRLFLSLAAVLVPLLVLLRLTGLVAVAERLSAAAEAARRNLAAVVAASPLPMTVLDPDGRATLWNPASEEMLGWSERDVVGRPWPIQPARKEDAAKAEALYREILDGRPVDGFELTLLTKHGTPVDASVWTTPLVAGAPQAAGTVVTAVDVTERKRQESEIRYLAGHDPLTGLPNRRFFEEALANAVRRGQESAGAALMVDLDNFKLVNDTAGHPTGDRFLSAVGKLLEAAVRPGDIVARLGGDEFGVLLHRVSVREAREVAERMLDSASRFRFHADGNAFDLGLSIGLAPLGDASDLETVLARADAALYRAKYEGKNRVVVVVAPVRDADAAAEATRLAARVKDALRENRLVLELQPIVELAHGSVAFREALVRLENDDGTLVPPGAFLSTAERFGLMPGIDSWIVENALRLLEDDPELRLFVNLAGSSLTDDALLQQIRAGVRRRVATGRLGFEVTEAAAVKDLERTRTRMGALSGLGCPIAIDDFGSGFSSFSHLKLLPADYVKIGMAFIRDVERDESSRAIVSAITEVAHALGKQAIAEGVERESTRRAVAELGIDFAQGFLLGEPEIPSSWARIVHRPGLARAS